MPDVTGITALDVAIGLTFVYLVFSLLCSAIQEAIAGIFDLRARTLEKGLQNLLDDPGQAGDNGAPLAVFGLPHDPSAAGGDPSAAGGDPLSSSLLSHGLIRPQYRQARWWSTRSGRRGPSYIPSRTFALALLDIVRERRPAADAGCAPQALAASIDAGPLPAGTKSALAALARDAGDDRERLRQSIEEWFDTAMARVSGWYKRTAQLVLCALAVLVTVFFNINSIAIADRLVRDDAVRAAVVAAATKTTLKPEAPLGPVTDEAAKTANLGLPLGWNKQAGDPARADLSSWHAAKRTLGGWFITIVMLSLGAPFWFSLLGRLVSLRSAGAKPDPAKPAPAPAA